ncbi:MAG: hypothetical protein R3324_11600, partial [Halobacteriales archaeon]|nr:hypothetical protein [Halobacteriales archaeon]
MLGTISIAAGLEAVGFVPLSMAADLANAGGIVFSHIGLLLLGVIVGMALGVIPGLGGLVALTVLL